MHALSAKDISSLLQRYKRKRLRTHNSRLNFRKGKGMRDTQHLCSKQYYVAQRGHTGTQHAKCTAC